MVWIIPTTLQSKNERFHEKFSLGYKEYHVTLTQIRTVSTKRFLRKIGMMSKKDFEKVTRRIVEFLQKKRRPAVKRIFSEAEAIIKTMITSTHKISSKPIIEIREIGKKYNITHQRGGYIALRDVLANILTLETAIKHII